MLLEDGKINALLTLLIVLALLFVEANKNAHRNCASDELLTQGYLLMVTLSDDEVALIKSLLIALRGIKTRDLDKALVILSKRERYSQRNS
jgi:hypothetical protein